MYTIHTNPGLQLELVSLYVMLPLSPTSPTSHLPNNTACGINDGLLREVESVQKYFPVYSFYRLLSLLMLHRK